MKSPSTVARRVGSQITGGVSIGTTDAEEGPRITLTTHTRLQLVHRR